MNFNYSCLDKDYINWDTVGVKNIGTNVPFYMTLSKAFAADETLITDRKRSVGLVITPSYLDPDKHLEKATKT